MSRYPNVGNASYTRHHSPYFTSTASISQQPLSSSELSSRSRHERQEHQLTTSCQLPRISSLTMSALPTLPPISTLDNLFSPNNSSYPYSSKSPSSEQYNRYSSTTPYSLNTPQSTPTTPYSASSTSSSFSYLPSPLPPTSTPAQNPSSQPPQQPHSQPSYYQQRSPQTSYYSRPAVSSYSQFPQTSNSPAQLSPRRTSQQIQPQYSLQQQSSSLYNLQTSSHHVQSQPSSTQQTHTTHTPIRPYQRSHTSQNIISEPFVTVTPELNNRPPRRRRRPPFSYSSLIAQAILDSPDRRLTLREVYQWIMERYPQLYKADDTGWQNTIRHNLSLNKCFKKVPRSDTELGHSTSSSAASKGKGGYWTIDPEYMSSYHDGVFARGGVQKRRPGEVGLHPGIGGTGIDDDSGGSDTSPSDNMAGRLVDVEDDNYHHHHNPHIHQQHQQHHHQQQQQQQQQQRYNHVPRSGMTGNTGERTQLTLTVPPIDVPSSSLMTPPLSSGILQKSKLITKRHSDQNYTNLASPAYPPNVNTSGPNSGRYDFHLNDLTGQHSPSSLDHSNSNRDISYSRSRGPSSEWDKRDIKMVIDRGDDPRSSGLAYYYGNHSMSPDESVPRNVIQQVNEVDSSNSSVAGSSSMKIRDLLN